MNTTIYRVSCSIRMSVSLVLCDICAWASERFKKLGSRCLRSAMHWHNEKESA